MLADYVEHLPPTAALWRAIDPDAMWAVSPDALLLAALVDAVQIGNWQRSGDKHARKPEPIPRPGLRPDSESYGSDQMTREETADWLGW